MSGLRRGRLLVWRCAFAVALVVGSCHCRRSARCRCVRVAWRRADGTGRRRTRMPLYGLPRRGLSARRFTTIWKEGLGSVAPSAEAACPILPRAAL
ncbi:hypothetical protein C8T65DRAFT_648962 [Cerioporus squamosus]|nr:hypothetical protein C8T65DRAFT_648962 [Cerioporus squamosus]